MGDQGTNKVVDTADGVALAAKVLPPAKGRDFWIAAAIVVFAVLLGGALFQASAISFDYMKLRGFAIYGSASSLPRFAETVRDIGHAGDSRIAAYRDVFHERDFGDLETLGRATLDPNLVTQARKITGLTTQASRFVDLEQRYQARCPVATNADAAKLMGNEGVEPPPLPQTQTPDLPVDACSIPATTCSDAASAQGSVRYRLICAEAARVATLQRRQSLAALTFDSARCYSDALRLTYPTFDPAKAAEAVRVSEAYLATACPETWGCGTRSQPGAPTTEKPVDSAGQTTAIARETPAPDQTVTADPAAPHPKAVGEPAAGPNATKATTRFWTKFWNWWLGWPLAILYLALGSIFGVLGSLARYLYQIAEPKIDAYGDPTAPALAGGGAAVLVLLIVMAGFQFLTVGASTPDLAYPNPMTVCGLSVLSGLAGDKVLQALQAFVARIFNQPVAAN
jgi:hypothetical protein